MSIVATRRHCPVPVTRFPNGVAVTSGHHVRSVQRFHNVYSQDWSAVVSDLGYLGAWQPARDLATATTALESDIVTYGFLLSVPNVALCAPGYDLAPLRCHGPALRVYDTTTRFPAGIATEAERVTGDSLAAIE